MFNNPNPKFFCVDIKEGSGAEVSPENVKISLGIPNIPDELFYALWSVTVGKHSFGTSKSNPMHPIYFEQAYVHMPDISKKETLEILAYSALHSVFSNYAPRKIGFFSGNRVFRFGKDYLTKGVEYLFNTYKDCSVYNGTTIENVFELLRREPDKVDITECRKGIKDEVAKRLEIIGYWDYIPIPLALRKTKKLTTFDFLS